MEFINRKLNLAALPINCVHDLKPSAVFCLLGNSALPWNAPGGCWTCTSPTFDPGIKCHRDDLFHTYNFHACVAFKLAVAWRLQTRWKIQFGKGVNLILYTAGFYDWRAWIELRFLAGCSRSSTRTFHVWTWLLFWPSLCAWGSSPSRSPAASSAWKGPPPSSLRPTKLSRRRITPASSKRRRASVRGGERRGEWRGDGRMSSNQTNQWKRKNYIYWQSSPSLQGFYGDGVISGPAAWNKLERHLWYFCSGLHEGEEDAGKLGLPHRWVGL